MDSEEIAEPKKGDLINVIVDFMNEINYKLVFFLFMIFLLLSSDVFLAQILSNINGAMELNTVTTYGTIIQGLFLILFYIIADMLIKTDLI